MASSKTRLTTLVKTGGCGSKMGPAALREALAGLPSSVTSGPGFIFGNGAGDDAAVFTVTKDLAIVQTVDFFAPIVDDPFDFGAIAAANALSDCYALGAKPITALNISLFPSTLETSVIREILAGGASKIEEAGAVLVGGHTVASVEPLYGLSVTGLVDPDKFISNRGAKPGHVLILTKQIGVGAVANALRADETRGQVSERLAADALTSMKTLNRIASEVMVEVGAAACTDVTGFSLLGHAHNVALASGVEFEIVAEAVPILAGLDQLPATASGGAGKRNRSWLGENVSVRPSVDEKVLSFMYDAQTSGPLMIVLEEARADQFLSTFRERSGTEAWVIGRVIAGTGGRIGVI